MQPRVCAVYRHGEVTVIVRDRCRDRKVSKSGSRRWCTAAWILSARCPTAWEKKLRNVFPAMSQAVLCRRVGSG